MIGVIEKENSLNKSEIEFVKDTSLNFRATSTPEDNRHYFKQTIEDYSKLSNFLEKSKNEFLKFGFGENKKLEVGEVWINKVTTDTNKKDDRHIDFNQLTSVTFINDDFEGGNLEISSNGSFYEIQPKINKTIFFQGSKLLHRVLPVTKGERFTLVTFWNWIPKNEKTLL